MVEHLQLTVLNKVTGFGSGLIKAYFEIIYWDIA